MTASAEDAQVTPIQYVRDIRYEWVTEVMRTHAVTPGCKVVLLGMSRRMRPDATLCRPRSLIASDVSMTCEAVARQQDAAIRAGLLIKVAESWGARPPIYQAVMPSHRAAER